MKNKKRIAIITSVVILLLIGGYFLYKYLTDEDQDKISRKVMISSYESVFLKEIEKRIGKSYEQIPETEKYAVLEKILQDKNELLKIVSIRYLSKLPDKEKSLKILSPVFDTDETSVIEEAIFSLKNYPKQNSEILLTEYIKRRISEPDYNIPFSGSYRIAVFGSSDKRKVELDLEESEQNQLNLANGEVYEINLLVPKGFDFMMSFPNFDDNWVRFSDSKIITGFSKTESYNDLKKLEVFSYYFKIKKIIDDKLGFLGSFFEPEKLFRDDLKIAKYGKEILLVTFKGRNLEIMTNLVNLFRSVSDFKFDILEESYKNVKIMTIQNNANKKTISYTDVAEYFVISDSPGLVKQSLDCFMTDNTNAITFDPNFQSEYNKLDVSGEKDFVFSYFNPVKLSPVENKSSNSSYLVKISLKMLKDLLGNEFDEKKYISRSSFSNQNDLSLLNFIPRDVPLYFHSSNSSPNSIWDYFTGLGTGFPDDLSGLKTINKSDLENNIIKNLGKNMFWSINGIDYGQNELDNKTALKICIGFKIGNVNKSVPVKNSMAGLFKTMFKKEISASQYQGYDIFSSDPVRLNMLTNQEMENSIAPSFSVVDGNLIIAMNRTLIHNMINTYKGGTGIDKSIINGNDDILFVDMEKSAGSYYRYISKYSGRSKSFNQFEIEDKIKPLFDVLKLIQNIQYSGITKDYHYSGKLVANLNYE